MLMSRDDQAVVQDQLRRFVEAENSRVDAWACVAAVHAAVSAGEGSESVAVRDGSGAEVTGDDAAAALQLLAVHRETLDAIEADLAEAARTRGWTLDQLAAAVGKGGKQAMGQHLSRLRKRADTVESERPRVRPVRTPPAGSNSAQDASGISEADSAQAGPRAATEAPVVADSIPAPRSAVAVQEVSSPGPVIDIEDLGPRFERSHISRPSPAGSGAWHRGRSASVTCRGCGYSPRPVGERMQLRQDNSVVWLEPDERDGWLVERRHCTRCAPNGRLRSIQCASCKNEGPLLTGTFAAPGPVGGAVRGWLTRQRWSETARGEWVCPNH